ncbi:hypothetical protein L0F63_007444, partial [Massospora cicadina]
LSLHRQFFYAIYRERVVHFLYKILPLARCCKDYSSLVKREDSELCVYYIYTRVLLRQLQRDVQFLFKIFPLARICKDYYDSNA